MEAKKQSLYTKKLKIILLIIIVIVSCGGAFYYYNSKQRKEQDISYHKVKAPIAIQLYEYNIATSQLLKYKKIPANTEIFASVEWMQDQGIGYYYKVKIDGRNDIYAEEIISKYFTEATSMLNYYDVFPLEEYNNIPAAYKSCIVDYFAKNDNDINKNYDFTSIKTRAVDVIAYGDFTGSGIRDIAILIENDVTNSYKMVIFHLDENHRCNVIYSEESSGLPIIKSFKKGTPIYIDDNDGEIKSVSSPNDGIIIKEKNRKYAVIFDSVYKNFEKYYQPTPTEVKDIEEVRKVEHEEEDLEQIDSTAIKGTYN